MAAWLFFLVESLFGQLASRFMGGILIVNLVMRWTAIDFLVIIFSFMRKKRGCALQNL